MKIVGCYFCVEMTCPECGADLESVNERRLNAREHVSIWRCTERLQHQFSVRVDMVPLVVRGAPFVSETDSDRLVHA